MKKILIITASIGMLVVSGAVAYYLLVVSPKIAADQLEFERQKQSSLEAQKKAELKQRCLEMTQEAASYSGDSIIPKFRNYAIANTNCDE